jgi:hypothetical protein
LVDVAITAWRELNTKPEILRFRDWNHEFTRKTTKNAACLVFVRVVSWFLLFREIHKRCVSTKLQLINKIWHLLLKHIFSENKICKIPKLVKLYFRSY